MKANKRVLITGIITALIIAFLAAYRLPFYIYKPGSADALDPIVEVVDGYESEGDMHLVTVRGGQATPIQWLMAKIRPYNQVYPIEQIRPEGISEEEYYHAQLQMMESSQEAAKVVAYQAANRDIEINFEGVFVMSVIQGMPAEEKLQSGDEILEVDGNKIEESSDLINYVTDMKKGSNVTLTIKRDEETLQKDIELAPFPDNPDKVGVGISLVTDRSVKVDPEVKVKSGEIGGPSAGLMFSLEIYDQLTENDITKGFQIAGTGEINYEGQVGRIGGIDKKVVAASNDGADIFFAPNEEGRENSNYQVAKRTAEDIETDMKVVPVDTFQEALTYLKDLKPA
ncbi:SepM family pheromone-processing serine protease [Halobacillus halophilus]|uniref:SepM family pheromone-processing serine protease n=1 Tax=Halobacillus halophilus TaxID=1570 RepID=UPI001CD30CA4|nr:SepM family pheromone-processing serine protease [Halobacillus halophilus]MCA1012527.1 PDZ domain-containing protein [Halobacillus halophilus]